MEPSVTETSPSIPTLNVRNPSEKAKELADCLLTKHERHKRVVKEGGELVFATLQTKLLLQSIGN